MKTKSFTFLAWQAVILLVAALLLSPWPAAEAGRDAPIATQAVKISAAVPEAPIVVAEEQRMKEAYPRLESILAQAQEAARANDRERLATFAGLRHLDIERGTARVILEMARDPEVRQAGPPTVEVVTLPDGRQARIEHAPRMAIRQDLADALAAAGASFETAHGNLVQVSVPLAALERLANLPDVAYVRLPFPAEPQALPARPAKQPFIGPVAPQVGAVTSEGVGNDTLPLTNIYKWHASPYNYGGTGVNLAVFDFGFTGWNTRQSNGDLPSGSNLVLKDYSASYAFGPPGTSGYEHGTACAEIAYDMAPKSKVYLYAFGTDVEFANAVDDYKGTGITGKKVATMSVSWVNAGPYDGTGSSGAPATKVNQAAAAGVFWANAAGNYQTQHYSWTSAQYSNTNYVAFGSGNVQGIGPTSGYLWNIPSGTVLGFYLAWNDWNADRTGNQNRRDYDLYLLRWTGSSWTTVASSLGNQCGSGSVPPTEAIVYTVPSGGPYNYGIAIARYQASGCTNSFGHWMQLFTFNGFYQADTGAVNSFWYTNPCNSITIPADADGAVAAGASFWGEDGNATYTYGLETFTSFGPRNASGGGNPGSAVNKPDVVAPDGVSTATYGASNNQPFRTSTSTGFFGTSASAPHVAGLAATIWEIYPSYSLSDLRNYIQGQALYKASGGSCGGSLLAAAAAPQSGTQNNRFGWGRIFIPDPSPQAVALAAFTADATADGVTLTWETVSETDNAGFNLYRSTTPLRSDDFSRPSPAWLKLNEALIPSAAPGSSTGHVYTYTDTTVEPGATYWYMLEDVALDGTATRHAPVQVTVGEPTALRLTSFRSAPFVVTTLVVSFVVTTLVVSLVAVRVRKRRP